MSNNILHFASEQINLMTFYYVQDQAFIQQVLLMSVFKQRLNFQIFYSITSNPEIIVKCRWGSGGAVSSAVGSWWSLGGGSGSKKPENFLFFYIWRAN